MPISPASTRARRESLPCGPRRSVRRRLLALALPLALLAGAAAPAPEGARAQTTQQPAQPLPRVPVPQAVPQQSQQEQPAEPGDGTVAGQVHGDWIERCTPTPPPGASPPPPGKQSACFLVQQVMDKNTQRPVLKITVGFFGQQRQAGAVVAMPLGVPLAHGLKLSVDGKELHTVPFQVCRRDGCQAYVELSEAAVSAFKAGHQAEATVASTQGEGLNLPISLKGFTAGYGAIQ